MQDAAANLLSWEVIGKLGLVAGLSSGLIAALATQGLIWLREARQRGEKNRQDGTAFALCHVERLTAFAQECISRLGDNGNDDGRGELGRHTSMPAPVKVDDGPNWGLLKPSIAAAIKDFYNEVEEAERDMASTYDVLGAVEVVDTANNKFVLLGCRAVEICDIQRKEYRLGAYQGIGSYRFDESIREQYRKLMPGLHIRIWRSLFIYRIRCRIRRRYCQLRRLVWRLMDRSSAEGSEQQLS